MYTVNLYILYDLIMVRPVGVEPTAFWSVAKRSIQLSYGRIFLSTLLVYTKI